MESLIGAGIAMFFGFGCLLIVFGIIVCSREREKFEKKAIEAGVGAYDSQTKEFRFLKPGR